MPDGTSINVGHSTSEPLDPIPGSVKAEKCPNRERHADSPTGYMAWHAWAAEMAETHDSHRCPGCNLFLIWTPKSVVPSGHKDPSAEEAS